MEKGKLSVAAAVLIAAQASAMSETESSMSKEYQGDLNEVVSSHENKLVDLSPDKNLHHGCPHVFGVMGMCN